MSHGLHNREPQEYCSSICIHVICPFTECVPSADGNKLLIYSRGATTYYESIGVLDFSNRTYIRFSRENVGGVNEHNAYWFDNDSVVIATSGDDDTRQYYIYRLLDK